LNSIPAVSRSQRLLQPDVLCAMLFVLAHGALLLVWPIVPTQDAPLWISEGALLHTFFRTHFAGGCQMVTALPPYALSQGVIGLLCWIMPPELAGRLFIVACVGLSAAALIYLCRARGTAGRQVALLCCLPLCVGYPLFHGFLNSMAALPVLCWGIGFLLRNPEGRGPGGACVLLVMPLLTYLCHGTAVGIWTVLVVMQVLVRRSRGFALRAALGFLPVLWLVAAYIQQRGGEGAGVLWTAGDVLTTISYRLRSPLRFFSVFPGFVPTFGDPALGRLAPLLMIVNVTYAVAISFYGLRWAWRARRSSDVSERWLSSSLLVLAGLFVLMPHDVAKMLNPAERLLFPAACLGAAGLAGSSDGDQSSARRRPWAHVALYGLLGAQWAYLAVWGTQAATIAGAFVQTYARYAAGPGVRVVQAEDVRLPLEHSSPRLPRAIELMTQHQVLLHLDSLEEWTHGRTAALPDTGLFRCPAVRAGSNNLDALRSAGPILLLIGETERASALAQVLEPDFRVMRPGPGFWTLAARSNHAPPVMSHQ
jgi:hypothetical protein